MKIINNKSLVLGVMSGTSLDGIDITCARYYRDNKQWKFQLLAFETFEYSQKIKLDLIKTFHKEYDLKKMDLKFGVLISNYISIFLKKYKLSADLISSHGHTIFHDPDNNYTKQIGLGSVIAKSLNIPVVSNFREQDVSFGGQGAPLVPIGDRLLFGQYSSCLNLGGIANISFEFKKRRSAFDICPCNMILNFLSNKLGKDFDKSGIIASEGIINIPLLNALNKIEYYNLSFPKSLGKEYVDNIFLSIISQFSVSTQDVLATFIEHIAIQISHIFLQFNIQNSLLTGGGVFNDFLISRICSLTKTKIIIPDKSIIDFKEAIIFGFLGVLRVLNINNCLASVTGAKENHCSGDIYIS